jgi:hypothetical protein
MASTQAKVPAPVQHGEGRVRLRGGYRDKKIIVENFSVSTPVLWTTIMTPIKPQITKSINFFERLNKYLIFLTLSDL